MNAGLTTTLFTSIVLHLLGLTALSMVSGSLWPVTPLPSLIPTEMLVEPPPPSCQNRTLSRSRNHCLQNLWSSQSLCLPPAEPEPVTPPNWRR